MSSSKQPPWEQGKQKARANGQWAPAHILDFIGFARFPDEVLPRLIVAAAVFEGPLRVLSVAERIVYLNRRSVPKLKGMAREPALQKRHGDLENVLRALESSAKEIPGLRARAANDVENQGTRSEGGLILSDIRALISHVRSAIAAHEFSIRQNISSIEFALAMIQNPPDESYVRQWFRDFFGLEDLPTVLLFTPKELGRVLLVYRDGRLAHSPWGKIG